ncbi:MAG: hypothetical protein LBG15_14510 [Dysgonamonadaceae bacterium]|jgi:hypothetical protein|nr:hypothetical protein [Dysgonamonadaceae bacterium]
MNKDKIKGITIKTVIDNGFLANDDKSLQYFIANSNQCYNFVGFVLKNTRPVLKNFNL